MRNENKPLGFLQFVWNNLTKCTLTTMFLFALYSFFPGTQPFVGDNLATASVFPFFLIGLNSKMSAYLLGVSFPRYFRLIGGLNWLTKFFRETGTVMAIMVSTWLTIGGTVALCRGVFEWRLFVLAALFPAIYWFLFIKDANREDLRRAAEKSRRPKTKIQTAALIFCQVTTVILLVCLPIYLIGDLYNSPAIEIFSKK